MTLLERKKRQYESSKMIKSIRKVLQKRNHASYRRNTATTNYNYNNNNRAMVPLVIPSSSSSSKSSLQQQRHPVPNNNRITMDEMTCKIIELVVEKLLYDNLSVLKHKNVTILELGNALVSSRHVLDSYANASSVDNSSSSSSSLLLSSANRGRFWNNTMQRHRRNQRKQQMINERIQIQRRYAWMNVMNQLQSKANASTDTITTWEDAKNVLRTVLVFPNEDDNDNDSNDDAVKEKEADSSKEEGVITTKTSATAASRDDDAVDRNDENVKAIVTTTTSTPSKVNKKQLFKSTSADSFIQRLEAIKLEETSKSIGIMLPSQHKWQEVLVQASVSTVTIRQLEKETKLLQEKYDSYDEKYDTYKTHKKDVLLKLDQKLELIEKEKLAREKVATLLRPLTKDEMQSVTHELANQKANPNEIIRQVGTDVLVRSSFQTLRPGQWLNDEVIHYFLIMLQNRDEQLCSNANNHRKRCHFFKSFFMTKLRNEGHPKLDGQYIYSNVKRWSKNVPGKDIFALRQIFFVINVGQMHWTCACAHMDECAIQFYDSMGSSGNGGGGGIHYLKDIFQYIQDEHKDKKKVPLPNVDDWKLIPCTSDTPRQLNGFDCGVFTCMFADFLSIDCPLIFSQEHVTECRQRIALSILQGKALM